MRRSEGIAYLTQCADNEGKHWSGGVSYPASECPTCHGSNDAGWLKTFSQYGSTSSECAPVAWRLAYLIARETGEPVTRESLEHAMSLVVSDHDDVAHVIRTYGYRHYV